MERTDVGSQARVLIVDDSPTARSIIIRILQGRYVLETAGDGMKALEAVAENPPDLIILDLLMPGVDGIGVLRTLKERHSKVPVLVVSADIQESTRARVLDLGARLFINKPVAKDALVEAVEAILGRAPEPGR
jgi:DNA-binding response OmpR family regulator